MPISINTWRLVMPEVPGQLDTASILLDKILQHDDTDACEQLKKLQDGTLLHEQEKSTLFHAALAKANQDKKPALLLYFVAWCYRYGLGCQVDVLKAFEWIKIASALDPTNLVIKDFLENKFTLFIPEHSTIAECFAGGEIKHLFQLQTIIKNNTEAATLFKICHDKLNEKATAQLYYFLAWCYYHGYGTQANKEKAKQYAQISSRKEFADADVLMAYCIERLENPDAPNKSERVQAYYQKAADRGSLLGSYNLLLRDLQFPPGLIGSLSENTSRYNTALALKKLATKGCPDAAVVAASQFNLQDAFDQAIECLRIAAYFDPYQMFKEEIHEKMAFVYQYASKNILAERRYDLAILQYYFNDDSKLTRLINEIKMPYIFINKIQDDRFLNEGTIAKALSLLYKANKYSFNIESLFKRSLKQDWLKVLARLAQINFEKFITLLYQEKLSIDTKQTILTTLVTTEMQLDEKTEAKLYEQIQQISSYPIISILQDEYKKCAEPKKSDIETMIMMAMLAIEQVNKIPKETTFILPIQLRNNITQIAINFLKLANHRYGKNQNITAIIESKINDLKPDDKNKQMYLSFFQEHATKFEVPSNKVNPKPHALNAPRAVRT